MNLEQSDSFKDEIEKNTKRRKGVMLSIVLCACLIAFLFIIIMILKYQDSITEKLFLDDKQIAIPSGLYKDIEGKVYAVKPNCTHLGCLLTWNNLDKTWDCPCHGSRFDYMGRNIYEPAIKDLDLKQI